MIFGYHPSNNMLLGPAKGTEEWCGKLPATMSTDAFGTVITSFWKPTPEELALLNANGFVALSIHSNSHPIVSIVALP